MKVEEKDSISCGILSYKKGKLKMEREEIRLTMPYDIVLRLSSGEITESQAWKETLKIYKSETREQIEEKIKIGEYKLVDLNKQEGCSKWKR